MSAGRGILILALFASGTAIGGEFPITVEPHADVKTFWNATAPYDHLLMPEAPFAVGTLDVRGRAIARVAGVAQLEVHHAVTGSGVADTLAGFGPTTGVGQQAPQLVDLGWELEEDTGMTLQGRTDRLVLSSQIGVVDMAVGRQPITFGNGRFFSPLDLVNPFFPTTIDTEYKPGVDAARVDVYPTLTSKITGVAALAADPDEKDAPWVYALNGQVTVGVTDVSLFAGRILDDTVGGLSIASSVGPVGLYSDVAFTSPAEGDAFVRAVAGADYRPTATTTVSVEGSYQGIGTNDPSEYLGLAVSERFERGELWTFGRAYVGVSVLQEITPLTLLSLTGLTNVDDGSALLIPALSVNAAGNVDLAFGGFIGLGPRPEEVDLLQLATGDVGIQSEFGLYPTTIYAATKVYL